MLKTVGTVSLLLLVTLGHAAQVTRVQYLMGALCEIRASGETDKSVGQAVTSAFEEISRLERVLTTYSQTSEVSRLNRLGGRKAQKCSPDLFALLKRSIAYSQITNGAFDVTVHPLIRYWSAPKSSSSQASEILKHVGYQRVELIEDDRTAFFKLPGMSVDFGGIGKGYALDKAAEVLRQSGIQKAELNFSGNILIINETGKPHPILLTDPTDPQRTILTLAVSNGSASTSSQLERGGHIIDPRTGRPADFQGSVTVIAPTATEADALSTALLVLGPKKGVSLIEQHFKDSAVLFLIPSSQGWIQTASSNFKRFLWPDGPKPSQSRATDPILK